ncbi:MauE/DoxX family redox-associated membrane protein [Plantactinospora sonchi]|uniref:MauE/DoxX family redox-associated membrane protein n=1 Tax=Plantactinospora sonchi TaxID=1544735 RepID=A0ABU7RXT7_9ACTN
MEYLEIAIRCLLGVVFLASSLTKVAGRDAFDAFVGSVRELRLLPPGLGRPVARLVVVAEFGVWVLLALPTFWTYLVGLVVAEALLVAFAVGVGVSVRRGVRAPCRCFGASATPLGRRQVIRNVVLAVVPAVGVVAGLGAGPTRAGGVVAALLGGLLSGGLVVVLDDILDLFQSVTPGPDPVRGPR